MHSSLIPGMARSSVRSIASGSHAFRRATDGWTLLRLSHLLRNPRRPISASTYGPYGPTPTTGRSSLKDRPDECRAVGRRNAAPQLDQMERLIPVAEAR
jgi:hypothetical protein